MLEFSSAGMQNALEFGAIYNTGTNLKPLPSKNLVQLNFTYQ